MPSGPSTVFSAATKQRIIGVLRSAAAQKIDFYLGYLHVSGFGYGAVADAVSRGAIGIRFGELELGAAAAFDGEDKVFDFPDGGVYGAKSRRAIEHRP